MMRVFYLVVGGTITIMAAIGTTAGNYLLSEIRQDQLNITQYGREIAGQSQGQQDVLRRLGRIEDKLDRLAGASGSGR